MNNLIFRSAVGVSRGSAGMGSLNNWLSGRNATGSTSASTGPSDSSTKGQLQSKLSQTISQLPERPLRPASAYAYFFGTRVKLEKKRNPDVKMTNVGKMVADAWKSLDPHDKLIYETKANEAKEAYAVKIKEYNKIVKQKVTIEDVSKLFRNLQEESSKKKKTTASHGKSGYNLFFAEVIKGQTGRPDLASVGKKWQQLPESVRNEYNQRAAQTRVKSS